MIRAPTMMMTTIMATTAGMKYKSAIDAGAGVAAGGAVGAGVAELKCVSAEDE